MFAPCGINCAVCFKHVDIEKSGTPCEGCLNGDSGKTERCRTCIIKSCAQKKGHEQCYECQDFPCKLIEDLDQSYIERFQISLVGNSGIASTRGVTVFLEQERQKWTCPKCGGAICLQEGICSDCGTICFPRKSHPQ